MSEQRDAHGDVELLLPWYVNGTLGDEERHFVEPHLADCGHCREAVEELEALQRAAAANQAIPLVPEPPVGEFMSHLDRVESEPGTFAATWRIAASVLLLGLIGLFWATGITNRPEPEFRTATSTGDMVEQTWVVEIRFDSRTSESERERLVSSVGAKTLSARIDNAGDIVRIEARARSIAELDELIDQLERSGSVQSARVVAMHVPVDENVP